MVKGPLNQNDICLGENWQPKKKKLVLYKEKNNFKNAHKMRQIENLERKKCISFSCPKDHSTKKLGSQVISCALQPFYGQSDYCGQWRPFQGLRTFSHQTIIMDRSNTPKLTHVFRPTYTWIFPRVSVNKHYLALQLFQSM